jgi:hypothetical protein
VAAFQGAALVAAVVGGRVIQLAQGAAGDDGQGAEPAAV